MIEQLLHVLNSCGWVGVNSPQPMGDEDIADALWLALQIAQRTPPADTADFASPSSSRERPSTVPSLLSQSSAKALPNVPMVLDSPSSSVEDLQETPFGLESELSIKVSASPALPTPTAFSRALKYLRRKVPSKSRSVLDVEATVDQIAKRDVWLPVIKPDLERWLDLELVIEASEFCFIWQITLNELQHHLERQCGFRSVRTWDLSGVEDGHLHLSPRGVGGSSSNNRSPHELIDSPGRKVILLVTDCRSLVWQQGSIHDLLKLWSSHAPLTIVQLLPERLWSTTALNLGQSVQVSAISAAVPNTALRIRAALDQSQYQRNSLLLPIVTLTTASLKQWAFVLSGNGNQSMPARLFDLAWVRSAASHHYQPRPEQSLSPADRLELFLATASPITQRLAITMSCLPVYLRLIHMLQQRLLPEVQVVHIAEFYSSELIEKRPYGTAKDGSPLYDFVPGVRQVLSELIPEDEAIFVLDDLSQTIAATLGLNINSFTALLSPQSTWTPEVRETLLPFAYMATTILHRLGGDYAELARAVEADAKLQENWLEVEAALPALTTFSYTDAQLYDPSDPSLLPVLQAGTVSVATLVRQSVSSRRSLEFTIATIVRREGEWEIERHPGSTESYFSDSLPQDQSLEMIGIPGGTFLMGSPDDEAGRYDDESPQHQVTVNPFFLGRYPVTQAQWRAVAQLPEQNRSLNPEPSRFKGALRPVERVSWDAAIEFCARLSVYTGREYRLPSEAEWEYACRAGTRTPFHFGVSITPELANYDHRVAYDGGPTGSESTETTRVDHYGIANAFGLSDMHGNVWEWCQDHWHSDYEGAPADGSAWLNENDNRSQRVYRGGSWGHYPRHCRSAYRNDPYPAADNGNLGFRVSVSAPRT